MAVPRNLQRRYPTGGGWLTRTFDSRIRTIPDGTCISIIALDMADIILTATKLAPRSKRPRGAQSWFVGPGMEAEMNVAP